MIYVLLSAAVNHHIDFFHNHPIVVSPEFCCLCKSQKQMEICFKSYQQLKDSAWGSCKSRYTLASERSRRLNAGANPVCIDKYSCLLVFTCSVITSIPDIDKSRLKLLRHGKLTVWTNLCMVKLRGLSETSHHLRTSYINKMHILFAFCLSLQLIRADLS